MERTAICVESENR